MVMPCDDCPLNLAKALHDLSGNRHFFRLVSDQRSAYASASEEERSSIVDTIFQTIRKKQGSFLKATMTISKKRPRMLTTADQQTEEYTRFRLQHGFPDILNDKLGQRSFKCAVPGTSTMRSPSVERQNDDGLHSLSKVFNVEHAPKVGLVDGFLVWNNENPSKNPKIKLSDMSKIDELATGTTLYTEASSQKADEQKKDANESNGETNQRLPNGDNTKSSDVATEERAPNETRVGQKCKNVERAPVEEPSAKRNCLDSTPPNGLQSAKRTNSENDPSSNVE